MKILTPNRRQFLTTSGLTLSFSGRQPCSLENDALKFHLALAKDRISARSFENKLVGQIVDLPTEEFLLEFEGGDTISSSDLDLRLGTIDKRRLELLFSEGSGLEARVYYHLPAESQYLRKQISVRQTRGPARRLLRADLENWQGVRRGWDSMHGDRYPYGSHPIFCDHLWAGVEFVAAFNEYSPDGFTLRSRPGGITIGPQWTNLHSTVIGTAKAGGVRDAFLRYIEDIRLAPARLLACYNSWWTLPKVVKQRDNLGLIKELKTAMYERYGVFFDIITTDMGWSHPRSIWAIDRSILPQGFDDIRKIVESAGGKLGIWMSPSEVYPPVCDYEWAEKSGYFVLHPERNQLAGQPPVFRQPGLSLADPSYRRETKQQLKRLIRENGLGHIKYDGFWAIEHNPHHGLLPHQDSVEPLAAHSLELLQASKEANPELVTEPTYLNSITNYISPWILKYSDTVWANAMDCVVGIGPAPDYRESHTNAREYMIFQSLDQVWLPQNALHYFDIIHVDEREGFPNHVAMAVGRGRFFLSTYLNPKLMGDEDWRVYAGLLRWARRNQDILRHTMVIPSRVESGEPYIYAHWFDARGILALRNPSNESKEFTVDLTLVGAPKDLYDAVCYTQYPYRRGIATGLTGRSQVSLRLTPWELLFLEIVPRSQLKETIAVGARWYREANETQSVVPDAGVETIRLLEPGRDERRISVTSRKQHPLTGELKSRTVRPVAENEWLEAKPRTVALFPFRYPETFHQETVAGWKQTEWKSVQWKKIPTVEFELECSVSIPSEAAISAKVLLLVEFPGREPRPSLCSGWVDDGPMSLEERGSEEHIGFYHWTGDLRPFESEWRWYIGSIRGGSHRIGFSGRAGHPNPRIGLWVWIESDLAGHKQPVSVHCSEAAMPQYRDLLDRQGIRILSPV